MIWFIVIISILLYFHGKWTFSYWSRRGVKQDSLFSFLRTLRRQGLNRVSDTEVYEELYARNPGERFVGSYCVTTPLLVLRDPELIRHVLVTDFNAFYSRSLHPLDKVPEPFLNNLFSCEGDLWKLVRQSLTPAFSPSKVKAMFPLILTRAEKLQMACEAADYIDAKDLLERYSIDVTGACGFGINTDTLSDEHETFLKLAQRIFTRTPRDVLIYILKVIVPSLCTGLRLVAPFIENTTRSLVDIIMRQRDFKPSGRNDFIDLMLELRAKGRIVGRSLTRRGGESGGAGGEAELVFDDALLAAQVFLFFGAGADTSACAASFTLSELAHHPRHQERCREEVDRVLASHGGQLTFEAIKEMKYLSACFREAMRIFPPTGYLMRKCMTHYTLPGTRVTLTPGVLVAVPTQALHMDPQYFPDPAEFRPERFCADAAPSKVYLPFGAGPRACIGELLGHTQSLAALATLLRRARLRAAGARPARRAVEPGTIITQKVKGPLAIQILPR